MMKAKNNPNQLLKNFLKLFAISFPIFLFLYVAFDLAMDAISFGKYSDYSQGDYIRQVNIPFIVMYSLAQLFFYAVPIYLLVRTRLFSRPDAEKSLAVVFAIISVQIFSFTSSLQYEDQISMVLPHQIFFSVYSFFEMRGYLLIAEVFCALMFGGFLIARNLRHNKVE